MASQPSYRELVAWQRADDLFISVHTLVREHFPTEERFCLTAQLRRAALSVPANIVEGDARFHPAERVQFLRIAWASLAEAGYYLHVARRLGYLTEAVYAEIERQIRETAAPLGGLIRRYRR